MTWFLTIAVLSGTVTIAAVGMLILGLALGVVLALHRMQEPAQPVDEGQPGVRQARNRDVPLARSKQRIPLVSVGAGDRVHRLRRGFLGPWDRIRTLWWRFRDRIRGLRDPIRAIWWRSRDHIWGLRDRIGAMWWRFQDRTWGLRDRIRAIWWHFRDRF